MAADYLTDGQGKWPERIYRMVEISPGVYVMREVKPGFEPVG